MPETTNVSLIRRVQNPSDTESWRQFVAVYEPLLISYVRSRGLREDDARDVVQQIFCVVAKNAAGIQTGLRARALPHLVVASGLSRHCRLGPPAANASAGRGEMAGARIPRLGSCGADRCGRRA